VASLGSLALILLLTIAVILGWSNYRTGLALKSAEEQRINAVTAAGEAVREEGRAEGNLQLALVAFEGIMQNLASRGVPDSLEVDLGDGEVFYDVVVTSADAALLQTLLSFYDQFARQNKTDLQLETATAYVRIGDIYQRLGSLEEAGTAFESALAVYDRLLAGSPESDELLLAKAETLNELAISLGRAGQVEEATRLHRQAESLLREDKSLLDSAAGKFELARTLNLLGSQVFRVGGDRMIGAIARSQALPTERGPRIGPGMFGRPIPPRAKRGPLADIPNSLDAQELLKQLVHTEPNKTEYRLALAQSFQNEYRHRQLTGSATDAEQALAKAMNFLEEAVERFPNVPAFQYSLADTLSLHMPQHRDVHPSDLQRIERAIGLASQLATTYPNVPEYQSLQGRLQSDLAAAQIRAGQLRDAEKNYQQAIELQQSLVHRYESVSLYRLTYAQSLFELAEIQRRRKQLNEARSSLEEAARQVEPYARGDQPSRRVYQRFLQQVYQRLAMTCRDMGEVRLAGDFAQKAREISDFDRPLPFGRFRFRPGSFSRRGWRGLGH
jgi:tetratricopeptide (TPR) repeat protein